MNIDRSAFDLRRELGCLVDDKEVVERLQTVFQQDWHDGSHYDPPDPLSVHLVEEDDHAHDPELVHE
jgi:cardiolipin synthase A/B